MRLKMAAFLLVGALGGWALSPASLAAPSSWSVASPDQTIHVDLALRPVRKADAVLQYRVRRGTTVAVDWSSLGLRYGDTDLGAGLRVVSAKTQPYTDDYRLIHGKASEISVRANRLSLDTTSAAGARMHVVFHVQNDGLGFRYEIPKQAALPDSAKITEEHTGFRIPSGARAWLQRETLPGSYEGGFAAGPAGLDATAFPRPRGPGWTRDKPALNAFMFPALFALPGKNPLHLLITESALDGNYTPMRMQGVVRDGVYTLDFPTDEEPAKVEYRAGPGRYPVVTLPFSSPWRVLAIGDPAAVFRTTLVTDLADPLDKMFGGTLPAWVKPGVATWDWHYYRRARGNEPKGPATGDIERQKRYVDAAAEFGWSYVLVDAGWPKWQGPDPYEQLRELARYADARGVGVEVWYHSHRIENPSGQRGTGNVRDREARRAEFALLADLGVKAIKVDFWDSDHQIFIARRLELLADAAEYRLMVNFHGDTLPRGLERRFPNFLTTEAVYGNEAFPTALHDVRLAFTRNVVGPMDFTPVAFGDALEARDLSFAHSLAQAVAFTSGLQHLADVADREDAGFRAVFKSYPVVADLLHGLPATWDESRLIAGDPDTHVIIARRKGDTWYVAGLNGEEQTRAVTFRPADLGIAKPVQLLLARDGTDRGNNFAIEERTIDATAPIAIDMRYMGGFLARMRVK
jgi:alpha-glucosidase